MKITETVRTDRVAPEVFRFLASFWRTAEWDPGVLAALPLDPGEPHVGQRVRVLVAVGPIGVPMVYVVTTLEPGRRVVLRGEGGPFVSVDDIQVTPSIDGCEIVWTAELTLHPALSWTEGAWRPGFKAVATAAMDGLRRRLSDGLPLDECRVTV